MALLRSRSKTGSKIGNVYLFRVHFNDWPFNAVFHVLAVIGNGAAGLATPRALDSL